MKMDEQFKKELTKTNKFVNKVYDKMNLFPNPNEEINVATDHAGNPLPDDPRSVILSHSGLFITSQEQFATCTSWLHGNRSRNILLGQDGRALGEGRAICNQCEIVLSENWSDFKKLRDVGKKCGTTVCKPETFIEVSKFYLK